MEMAIRLFSAEVIAMIAIPASIPLLSTYQKMELIRIVPALTPPASLKALKSLRIDPLVFLLDSMF
jgi:hypothetical protein